MKNCNHCGKRKSDEDFNWRYKALGVRHKTCRECMAGFQKQYFQGDARERHLANVKERQVAAREAAQNFVLDYLSTYPCEVCGETDIRVLEFHHTGGKDMPVATMVSAVMQ